MVKKLALAAISCLVVAGVYTIGAIRANAQGAGQFAGIAAIEGSNGPTLVAITTAGDVYARNALPTKLNSSSLCTGGWSWLATSCPPDNGWVYMGNVSGGTVATAPVSWGAAKQTFRK